MSGILCTYNDNNISHKSFINSITNSLSFNEDDYIHTFEIKNGFMGSVIPSFYEDNEQHEYEYFKKNIHIVFKGRLKRNSDLIHILNEYGYDISSLCDKEIISILYCLFSYQCLDYLDGYFSFIIFDHGKVFAVRDHLGILPLYYYVKDNAIVIASKIKCILDFKKDCVVDKDGLKELLGLGPSMSPGKTIYKDIYALKPASYIVFENNQLSTFQYWSLKKKDHVDSYEETVNHIKSLINENTLFHISDLNKPACFLSGGLDSSLICSLISQYTNNFDTYSLHYEDQDKYFSSNEYQSTQDDYYIQIMNDYLGNSHHNIIVSQKELVSYLFKAMEARDMPGMSDIDSSLLVLLNKINNDNEVILSGECADEIFGGYPWFYKKELYKQNHFPWMRDLNHRIDFLNNSLDYLKIKDYIVDHYHNSCNEELSIIKRTIILNYLWFMQTLLIRGETMSNILNKEIRMPFASKEIIEYVFNIPDEYFFINNEEKSLLRVAFEKLLPNEVMHRKKNPFPKTYSPEYTNMIVSELSERLSNKDSILYKLFNSEKLNELIKTKGESFKYPWYGQLMKGPQFMAYLIQIDMWAKHYDVKIES